ncbi:hypothetical protein [Bacillus marinisedimentorum]|uniref:hypothetical protein n=1 Tax=Bacillus marinisedimentorum TaxID=1821260 RepID=UPI000871F428|nr:hypothetical protein [Bacillus marinisedimentorum]
MKKNRFLFTAILLSVLVLFTGCSEKSGGDTEEKETLTKGLPNEKIVESFVVNEFTGPGVELENALDKGPNSPEVKKYLEVNYNSVVTDPQAFYNKNFILMYLSAAYRNGYQLDPKTIDIEKVDGSNEAYYYEVEVEYSKDGEAKTAVASGRVNINEDGKISTVRMHGGGLLQEMEEDRTPKNQFHTGIPSIKKISSDESVSAFDHAYEEMCWNDCGDKRSYTYPDIHPGDAEIGDRILIDWGTMKQPPSKVRLIRVTSSGEEIKEDINTNSPTLNIQVDDEKIGKQYAVHFLWKDGEKFKGHSVLTFKLGREGSGGDIGISSGEEAVQRLKQQLPEGKDKDVSFGADETIRTDDNGSYYVVQLVSISTRASGKTGTLGYYKVYQDGTYELF